MITLRTLSFRSLRATEFAASTSQSRKFSYDDKDDVVPKSFFEAEKHRESRVSVFQVFGTKKNQFLELHRVNPLKFSFEKFRDWKERAEHRFEIQKQQFVPERHTLLGSDLATAHFIVFRGGRVKFHNQDRWIEKGDDEENLDLPKFFVKGLFLQAVDASNVNLLYEGLCNFIELRRLQDLILRNSPHVDDWFLDRISGLYSDSLINLDISGCTQVTARGLSCIYRLRNLQNLVVENVSNSKDFELMCFHLEDVMKNLKISGVNVFNKAASN